MKKFTILLTFAMVLVLAACGNGNGDGNGGEEADGEGNGEGEGRVAELQEEGTVNVGFANEPPYAYQDSDSGELEGANIEIAKAVFQEMGIEEVNGHLTDWGELIPGVQAGQYDVITAGMAILPDRCENAAFSEPEMQYGEGLVVAAGNPYDIHSYADIADNEEVTLALMEGTTQFDFVDQEGVSDDQIMSVADIPGQLSAVQSGNADVAAATEATLRAAYESLDSDDVELVEDFEQPDISGVPSYGAAAFNMDDEELRDAYNEALETLKEDGTIDDILDDAEGFTADANRVEVGEMTADELCAGEEEEEE
ncbi:ectoine/hydroxyectoine ABC transporter substrate-binding protein EhuB [Lacicoccus alkaliphilus]|uniref:Amino acid ABC transporter substrate-binding protein, PAAT family (TC 3.A.1.3.-) n=1 Tax=Lacicoccus alkaliphilus DSM 16010 TaxID=1123231 RepID=A0A1M7EAY9_9BACL|nr:ectoine/hydroxyectoine ABC transporter substrate-binding protein EhuB [Salinicoccus alkaliphilus]SHL88897.1 amino acid ABC transporter substrate-binding protein, PAAT family (TC 3.A.1.3.-) [Salinicoccus alkaliphilus DSM 16010]